MNSKGSYNLSQYFPRKESFQNLVASLPPLSFVSYLSAKFDLNKHFGAKEKGVQCSSVNSKKSSLPLSLDLILEKFSAYTNYAHSLVFGKPAENKHMNKDVKKYEKVVSDIVKSELDPDDYYHAMKNNYKNVPKCCTEPYILNGYLLPFMPWRYYLKVLWIPNNEMLNVWTHLFPSFCFMWMLYSFSQTLDLIEKWPLLTINFSAIVLTLLSATAHTFHSRSSYYHCCWFILDYFGITFYAFGSTVAHFFSGSQESYYSNIGWYNLLVLTLICFAGFYCCSLSQTKRRDCVNNGRHYKLWANGIGYFYGTLPLVHRLFATWGTDDHAMVYHVLQVAFMLLCPLWYASDLPQKLWPGKFDLLGHSHQIFHLFGALACYFDICAVHIDVTTNQWSSLKSQVDYPSFTAVCICMLALCVYGLVVGALFSRHIKCDFEDENDHMHRCTCALASFYTGDDDNNRLTKRD